VVALLLNSFFPAHRSAAAQLRRALALLKKSPQAAKVFFGGVHAHVTPA